MRRTKTKRGVRIVAVSAAQKIATNRHRFFDEGEGFDAAPCAFQETLRRRSISTWILDIVVFQIPLQGQNVFVPIWCSTAIPTPTMYSFQLCHSLSGKLASAVQIHSLSNPLAEFHSVVGKSIQGEGIVDGFDFYCCKKISPYV